MRIPQLDGLRAISILLVLAGHLLPLGPKSWQLNATAAGMGMSLFFALSGFLITATLLHNDSILDFAIKRVARIVPLAYPYIAVVFLLFTFDPPALFYSAAFVVNYVHTYLNSYNSHLWSLCVEMHFYAAIAIVVAIFGIKNIWVVFPACLFVTALRIVDGAHYSILTHLRVDEILAGAGLAVLNHRRTFTVAPQGAVAVAAITWFLSASPLTGPIQFSRPYATVLFFACAMTQTRNVFGTVLTSIPMRYIATISYALYMFHPITAHGWMNEGSVWIRYLFKRPVSLALTFTLAHLSTFYWERPCLKAAKRLIASNALDRRTGYRANK